MIMFMINRVSIIEWAVSKNVVKTFFFNGKDACRIVSQEAKEKEKH